MTKRPSKVRIGGHTYKVADWARGDADSAHADAEILPGLSLIKIKVGQTPYNEGNSVLHEVLHAIWDDLVLPPEGEEKLVTALSNGLCQVVVNNPTLFVWLAERLRS
jgi:hypothetical protein